MTRSSSTHTTACLARRNASKRLNHSLIWFQLAPARATTHTQPVKKCSAATAIVALTVALAGCGRGNGDGPRSPAAPTPTGRAATIVIEDFDATAAPAAGGQVTYAISLRARETAGVAATLSVVTLTANTPAGTISRDYAPNDAFGTNRVAANGTLPSGTFTLTAPVTATTVTARIPFTDENGNSGAATGTTTVRPAS